MKNILLKFTDESFFVVFLTEVSRRTKNQTGIRIGLKHMNEAT